MRLFRLFMFVGIVVACSGPGVVARAQENLPQSAQRTIEKYNNPLFKRDLALCVMNSLPLQAIRNGQNTSGSVLDFSMTAEKRRVVDKCMKGMGHDASDVVAGLARDPGPGIDREKAAKLRELQNDVRTYRAYNDAAARAAASDQPLPAPPPGFMEQYAPYLLQEDEAGAGAAPPASSRVYRYQAPVNRNKGDDSSGAPKRPSVWLPR